MELPNRADVWKSWSEVLWLAGVAGVDVVF
jgi:hypothetical protein